MAAYAQSIWAIEIGNESLKALRLSVFGDSLQVTGFENIRHGKILTGQGASQAERDELIALSLRHFMRENNIAKEDVVISIPSQNSFARFVDLPPVDEKKIPQIVKLEAGMQIPFDMSEVQWDWQLMTEPGAEQARVGIFAIKNDIVTKELEYFANEDIQVNTVQMSPMALYNYLVYDRPELVKSDNQAAAIINIGAENTDLVICSKSTVWQRCVPMGGNSFTRVIAEAFKLNFAKAEKLKRTAAMSKYARQVFQAMRPVFSDFVSEIQRSMGFYGNSNPDMKIKYMVAVGGGTKLRGLLKYLQQSLQIPIERPDSFKRLGISKDVSAAKFSENISDLGVVYGLALQGLGYGKIESNLLPRAIASSMAWANKAKYFTLAASVLLAVAVASMGRTILDKVRYDAQSDNRNKISSIISEANDAKRQLDRQSSRADEYKRTVASAYKVFEYRDVIPKVYETILSLFPNARNNPQQKELYEAFGQGDVSTVRKVPRKRRKQIFITGMDVRYSKNVEAAKFGDTKMEKVGGGDDMLSDNPFGMSNLPPEIVELYKGLEDAEDEPGQVSNEGFVVTIFGYSPYENLFELLDPAGVRNDPDKWGIVTRLMNLNEVIGSSNQFELFNKTEVEHFKLETGPVGLDADMPEGIGVRKKISSSQDDDKEYILVDPMTREIISKETAKDETGRDRTDNRGKKIYSINDHWFILSLKLRWLRPLSEASAAIQDVNEP